MGASPASAIIPPDTRCFRGMVAITFDDGPSKSYTPKLLTMLRKNHAQATFFVQGQYAKRYPSILREAVRDGHAIENHSWDHPELTKRSSKSVNRQLKLTQDAIRRAIQRTPTLFRPPYGDTSKRVRTIGRKHQLKQELWTIDTRDWSGRSSTEIRKAALKGLRPHRSNVILMHDAVNNSARTLDAVPRIIRGLRKQGYCLVPLQQMSPLGRVSASAVTVDEGTARSTLVPVTLQLDGLAQRRGTLDLRAVDGTATSGVNFEAISRIVTFRRGARAVTINVRIYPDPMPHATKEFSLQLSSPHGLRLSTKSIRVMITDNQQGEGGAATVGALSFASLRLAP